MPLSDPTCPTRSNDEVEAQTGKVLKESSKGGTGRYVVGDDDVDNAPALIEAAHHAVRAKAETPTVVGEIDKLSLAMTKARVGAIKAKESKPSGEQARSRRSESASAKVRV
jgi:hypothetical protein